MKTGRIFWKLTGFVITIRNESFKVRIRDPRYDTNLFKSGFVIHDTNRIFLSPDSWLRIDTNPWIRETNPCFYESLIRIPHPYLILSLGVEIFDPEVPQKVLIRSRYLDKSQKSRQISIILTVSMKILTQPSLDWKVSILKISTKKKSWSLY